MHDKLLIYKTSKLYMYLSSLGLFIPGSPKPLKKPVTVPAGQMNSTYTQTNNGYVHMRVRSRGRVLEPMNIRGRKHNRLPLQNRRISIRMIYFICMAASSIVAPISASSIVLLIDELQVEMYATCNAAGASIE
jgi:hypothetical protein